MRKRQFSTTVAMTVFLTFMISSVVSAKIISNTLTATFNIRSTTINVSTSQELANALADQNITTINLEAGTYIGQFTIDRTVTLSATNPETTIIQAPDNLVTKFTADGNNQPIIYVTNGATVTIKNLTVDGAKKGKADADRFYGIAFYNAGGMVEQVIVKDIKDGSDMSGMQDGIGIYAYNENKEERNISIKGSTITGYQKGGIALMGEGLSVNVSGNTVTGAGETTKIVQNGIQVSNGANGTVTENTVSGHIYTGTDLYDAAGIALSGNIPVSNTNICSNNDWSFRNVDAAYDVVLSGDINGESFTENAVTLSGINEGETVRVNITAQVNGIKEQTKDDSDLLLYFGDNVSNVTVKVGETIVEPISGMFNVGNVKLNGTTQAFNDITVAFKAAGNYTANIYVDDGQ